jgi:hypothetical protein
LTVLDWESGQKNDSNSKSFKFLSIKLSYSDFLKQKKCTVVKKFAHKVDKFRFLEQKMHQHKKMLSTKVDKFRFFETKKHQHKKNYKRTESIQKTQQNYSIPAVFPQTLSKQRNKRFFSDFFSLQNGCCCNNQQFRLSPTKHFECYCLNKLHLVDRTSTNCYLPDYQQIKGHEKLSLLYVEQRSLVLHVSFLCIFGQTNTAIPFFLSLHRAFDSDPVDGRCFYDLDARAADCSG